MITTKFKESFIRKKASEDEATVSTDEDGLIVERDGVDMTSRYSPHDFEETVADVFDMNVDEALDFSHRMRDFGGRRSVTDSSLRTTEKYRESYGEEKTSELADNLRVSGSNKSLGDDIWNFLKTPESDILAENAEEEIDEILEADSPRLEDQISEELEDEYQEAAEEAYNTVKDDISEIVGLAEISGSELYFDSFDTLKWLKDKQRTPEWNDNIDTDDVTKRLEGEVESQKRRKTLDALESQAHKVAAEHYEKITGQQPDQVDKDIIYGVRAHMMTEDPEDLELLEDILKHNKDVYTQESSHSYEKIGSLENAEFDTLRDGLGREKYELSSGEVEVYVASPLEALRYGDEFDTCHSITWEQDRHTQNKEAIIRSGSLTNPVIFAEDENGNIVGRDRMYRDIDEEKGEKELGNGGKSYTSIGDREINSELREVIEDYQEQMREEMGYMTPEKRSAIHNAELKSKYEEWHAPEHV